MTATPEEKTAHGLETRNEEPAEMVTVGDEAPGWLIDAAAEDDSSMAGTEEYRVLSRVKLIQGMSSMELKDAHGEGSAVIVPDGIKLCGKSEGFAFVPQFFFVEWTKQSDLRDKTNPFIMERSHDRGSDLAVRSRDPEKRREEYGDPLQDGKRMEMRYVEHLCFIGIIYDDESGLKGTPVCLSFEKGEFGTGQSWIAKIKARKVSGKTAPLYTQVWQFAPRFREKGERKWWGLDPSNPPREMLFIQPGELESARANHRELKTDFEKNKIVIDRRDESGAEEMTAAEASAQEVDI